MKLALSTIIFILCTALIAPKFAFAQTLGDADLIHAKTQVEDAINKRLRATVGTTLEKDTFEVSVQAELTQVSTNKPFTPVRKIASEPRALDLTAGLIDAEGLIRSYEEEIDNLKIRQEIITQTILQETNNKKEFKVKSLNIQVGLQEIYGEEYSKVFLDWLKKTTENDFSGISTNVEVNLIKSKPIEPKLPTGFFDYISQLQTLIAALLLFFTVLVSIFLIKRMSSKDATEERSLRARLQQQHNELQMERPAEPVIDIVEEDEQKLIPQRSLGQFELDMLKDVHSKVVWTVNQNTKNIKDIMSVWLDAGDRGYVKAACLLDVVASQNDRLKESNKIESILNFNDIIPDSVKKSMRSTFDKMADSSFEDRLKILEEVYWDLLSLKALGASYLQQPFDYISKVPTKDIQAMLEGQSGQMRALAVLHLPEAKQEEYLEKATFEQKKEIIENALNMNAVLVTDIETASETLKFEVKKKVNTQDTVSMQSLVPRLFASISVLDELLLLKDIVPKISDGGISLKKNIPSLAFIHEWPEEKARNLFTQATNDEVMSLVKVYADKKDQILNLCPSRIKTIVNDDFNLEDKMDIKTKNKHLSSLKLKLLKMVNKGEVDLDSIFTVSNNTEEAVRVAS